MAVQDAIGQRVTVDLLKPIGLGARQQTKVTLRAPCYADFIDIGEVELYVPVGEGRSGFIETNLQAVGRYVERLAQDTDPNFLAGACLEDSMRLRDAVLSFFRSARLRIAAPNTPGSDTPASSASDGPNPPVA